MIWLTRSISTGGMALTRSLAQHFNFEANQAEQYKKIYGLMEDQLEGKVFEALKPIIDIIAEEGKRMIRAFETKYPQNPIKRVVLSGGGAKMPGFVIYLANAFGLEVQEADPWYSIVKDKESASRLVQDAPSYSVAVGLALRED
ncbi:MAG: type IV pilus assembly protein PilM [Candidatus Daviesbacteria bacterium GW2011_GWF2_38_7]|nr:MAG: type IV pilus assembly protein PilM [Candidatus Daviesbacteria bacterium GW2011_GWF2_38_7]